MLLFIGARVVFSDFAVLRVRVLVALLVLGLRCRAFSSRLGPILVVLLALWPISPGWLCPRQPAVAVA